MLLTAAVVLIFVVLGGAATRVILDMEGRPRGEWFRAVKEWQPLTGSVLGFLGAAGVLVLSNELQANQRAAEQARAAYAIGYGLALEGEQLSGGLTTGLDIVAMIEAERPDDYARVCTEYLATLQRTLIGKTLVYDAVLPRLVDFGDQNLAVFVRFYGAYGDLLQEIASFDPRQCALNGESEIGYLKTKLQNILAVYRLIAETYHTAVPEQRPAPIAAPGQVTPLSPATTAITPTQRQ
jgi:hypothetical protein